MPYQPSRVPRGYIPNPGDLNFHYKTNRSFLLGLVPQHYRYLLTGLVLLGAGFAVVVCFLRITAFTTPSNTVLSVYKACYVTSHTL